MALCTRNVGFLLSKVSQNAAAFGITNRTIHSSYPVNSIQQSQPTTPLEGRTKCTLIPGDGVGPELVVAVQDVFKAAAVPVDFEMFFLSEVNQPMSAPLEQVAKSIMRNGICLKDLDDYSHTGEQKTLNMKLHNYLDLYANVVHVITLPGVNVRHQNIDAVIIREQTEGEYSALEHESVKGILATPDYSHTGELQTLNMKLRNYLDLYANVVHVKTLPGVNVRHQNIDAVIIREQTEGEYSALEHESVKGVVECLKIITKAKSERIAKFAFDYATRNNRKKVTAVHKANIMKLGDGLFLRSCQEMAKLYPKIQFETMIVDNCTMQMVSNPQQFDVMVTPNLYGNIIDNLASGLVGGAGVVAGASYSAECVVFEPGARHTFSEAVGKNVANPTAMLLCAAKMLTHVNLKHYGDMIRNAVNRVLTSGKVKTKDLGGQSTTKEYTYAIINNLH